MNIPQARQTLRKAIPPGEDLFSMNRGEFNWLQTNKPDWFGSGKKHKKSGLRSFEPNPYSGTTPDVQNIFGNTVSGATQDATHKAVADMGTIANPVHGGGVSSDGGGGVPGIPNPLAGGSETRTPTGPGSVTNPNDPYGIQKKIAGGASDLIDKEYVAPTLTPEERIAATSAETTQAREGVQAMQGTGQTAYGEAAGVGKRISGQEIDPISGQSFLTGKGVDEYMSPHTKNVIGGMQQNAMNTMQKQRGALQAQHQMAGAGMGSRGALENAAMMGEVQRNLGQQVSGALEGSYAQAAGMKEKDMTREQQRQRYNQMATSEEGKLRLAGAETGIKATDAGRDAGYKDIDYLSASGAAQEGYGQRDKDFAYDQFLEGRDWDKDNLMLASNVLGGAPSGATTTSSRPMHKKKDRFGRAIAGAGAGAAFGPWGAAIGGGLGYLS